MEESLEECDVCLGLATIWCQQCSGKYCRECNERRHSRRPNHTLVRLSLAPKGPINSRNSITGELILAILAVRHPVRMHSRH